MQQLFVVRHGEYRDKGLTDKGREQIRILGDHIKLHLRGDVYIFSSYAPRAIESSQGLLSKLELTHEIEIVPWLLGPETDGLRRQNSLEAITCIEARTENAVILVGHQPFVMGFPGHYLEYQGSKKGDFPSPAVGKALYFDLAKRQYKEIPDDIKFISF